MMWTAVEPEFVIISNNNKEAYATVPPNRLLK